MRVSGPAWLNWPTFVWRVWPRHEDRATGRRRFHRGNEPPAKTHHVYDLLELTDFPVAGVARYFTDNIILLPDEY
jgi:hypothetical protein